jgi:group I intron endonuclease
MKNYEFDIDPEYIRKSGIYKIYNTLNNKFYIGSAVNFRKRFNKHISDLRKNKHHSLLLQNSYNLHGHEHFRFVILEIIDNKSDLSVREQYYLDLLNPNDPNIGYNICSIVGSRLGVTINEETRLKKSIKQREVMSRPDVIEKIRKSNLSEYTKKLRSLATSGREWSDDSRKKLSENRIKSISEAGGFSDYTRNKMSKSKIGKKPNNMVSVERYSMEGLYIDTFQSIIDAVTFLRGMNIGISSSKISLCINGKRNKAGGYIWRMKQT